MPNGTDRKFSVQWSFAVLNSPSIVDNSRSSFESKTEPLVKAMPILNTQFTIESILVMNEQFFVFAAQNCWLLLYLFGIIYELH